MKLINFGGATAILEHKGKKILFDPWLDDGIFYGSWYHYPPAKIGIPDLGHIDYVFISHIHEDHCSPGTIKHINPDAEIFLMDRKPNYVLNFLNANGFKFKKIHLIAPRTPTQILDNLWVDMVTENPIHTYNYLIDSGLILKWDDMVIYNANDCSPYLDGINYIKNTYKKIDFALLPYAGGSGYPACYTNIPHEEKLEISSKIRQNWLNEFLISFESLQPKYIMPFANQYVIGGNRASLNQYLAHSPSPGVVYPLMEKKGYLKNLVLLNSGQSFDIESGEHFPKEPYHFHTEEEREEYIKKNLLEFKYEHEKINLNYSVAIDRLFSIARERLWNIQVNENYFPKTNIYIHVYDRKMTFELNFSKKEVRTLDANEKPSEPYIKMSFSSTLFAMMLIGHMSWNMADASLFIDYERVPNTYDPKVYAYLNFLKI